MSSIFPMISVAIFFGSRERVASNSAENICVAALGIALWAHGARVARTQVCLAALDGSLELRRHFHLVFEPLFQPFPQRLCVFHRKPCNCCFDLRNRAHGGHSSFCEAPLQAARIRDPKRSAEPVPPEPPRRRRGTMAVGGRASRGMRGGVSPSPLPERGAPFQNGKRREAK